ncbi:adhesion G-protein coupled receptor G6-like [Dreissena polymorpha]|nr:adhesion G-protein coupled receptor G6-like [Dreissena polymorpha]
MSRALGRHARLPVLQGSYWCEVWDRIHLQRERSRSYAVRFSDVISYHGSMKLPAFSDADALLFNMVNLESPVLAAAEMDMKTVFGDTLPQIQARMPEVTGVFTYIDRVTLGTHVVEYHTYFTLSRDYTGADEAAMYELVKSALLTTLSNREYMSRLPGGTPPRAFSEMHLHSTVSCPATSLQTNRDIYGNTVPKREFSFPRASLGEFVHSVDNCGANIAFPVATARCRGDFNTGAYWDDVKANDCVPVPEIDDLNEAIWGTSAYTDKLSEMARTILDENNAESVMTEVAQITKVAVKFTPTDINKIADVLDHATKLENLSLKVGEAVLRTVDRLLDTGNREVTAANVETKAANRIIKSLERFAENAKIDEGDKIRLVSDNLVVEIWNLKPAAKTVIGLAAESIADADAGTPFKTEHIATVYDKSHLYEANVDAAIELPAEVFQADDKGTRLSNRLTMMVFRKSRLFEAATDDAGRKLNPTAAQLTNINSYIISASIAGRRIEGLKEKVKTIFKPIKTDAGELACVWWDFNLNQMKGGWSQAGCSYDGKVNGRDVCLCDHLTNFAILVDFYGQNKPLDPSHELSLSIITLLGLSLSILGLALTIISYVFFRKLRQGRAQQTLFNLSLSLLLAMLVFLIGVKQTHNNVVCIVVAILLHYLIIVSFMWMLMEAILQYLTFVKILGTYITRFTLKTVLPAWGLPMIPVIAVLSVDPGLYRGGPKYCWMDLPAFFYAFAIPVSVIILTNVIIFIVTVISIFRRGKGLRSNQKKHKMAMTNLQAAITSFILLGLTWLFGYLAIADARLIFQYVFTILNSLQGFFIFVLFVLRKKKVREQWYFICCKGIEKDRVSRSLSSTNSNSTYSNGSARKDKDGRDRDRSDSTKTVQSTFSNGSGSFTNFGYDNTYDYPFNRIDRRLFNRKF